jgi:hypothetical protein
MCAQLPDGIESAFARSEADAVAALKAATAVVAAVRKYRGAAAQGNVRELGKAVEAVQHAVRAVDQEAANLAESWTFDDETYFQSGGYTAELIETARQAGVRISELDNRLYCYPALLNVVPGERLVTIDKKRERRVRPSVLVGLLQTMQKRPPRSRSDVFLEALFAAYRVAVAADRKQPGELGKVVPLTDLYELFTLAPGQSREYARQEFARDVYLLDQSGHDTTRSSARVSFHAGAGASLPRGTLSIVTQQGQERKYHGVAFTPAP